MARPSRKGGKTSDAKARNAGPAKGRKTTKKALGVQLQVVEARGPADFDRAFSEMSAKGAGALLVLTTPVFDIERQRIVDLAAKNRLPSM